jgi:hypothetical protein
MAEKARFPAWEYNKYLINPVDDKLDTSKDEFFDGIWHETYFAEKFEYTPIPLQKNLILWGFFQSEKYFDQQLVLNTLKPKNEFLQVVKAAGKEFLNLKNTVAIHVRHGDYLDKDKQECHPVLTAAYYDNAMQEMYYLLGPNVNFIFFSDDIAWCKQHYRGENIYYAQGNSDVVDLYLMAHCQHHIIANSSFSWWGAWLKKLFTDNSGFVIAPKTWFGPQLKHWNTKDIYVPGWKIME